MKLKATNLNAWALFPAALLIFTSCSSDRQSAVEGTSTGSYSYGVPGGTRVETRTLKADVTAIDPDTRKVTLRTADGKKTTVKCGPEVINFDQIHVGDQLRLKVTQQIIAYLADAATAPPDEARGVIALAPKGAKPGGVVADTVRVTAKVIAIDQRGHRATLEFPDGTTRQISVRPDVDLRNRHVGEQVVIRITEMVALSVEKPS